MTTLQAVSHQRNSGMNIKLDKPNKPQYATKDLMLISVVIANFNKAEYLPQLLDSIFKSTYKNFEIIFIDDCSTDDSLKTAAGYSLNILRNERNLGPAATRNIGAQKANGDVLLFLDSDVEISPTLIGKIAHWFEDENVAAISGSPRLPSLSNNRLGDFWTLDQQDVLDKLKTARGQLNIWASTMGAIRKDIFLQAGGFAEKYKKPDVEDHELALRLLNNHKFFFDASLEFRHAHDSHRLVCEKAFSRSYQLAAIHSLNQYAPFGFARKLSHILSPLILSLILVVPFYPPVFWLLALIVLIKGFYHRQLFARAYRHRGIHFVLYCFFAALLVNTCAICGYFVGTVSSWFKLNAYE